MNYALHLLIYLSIYLIVAMSLNMVVGYGGFLSLAHAGYCAVGAYAYALATLKLGWGFIPSVALGVIIALFLSLALSLASWKFKGNFFVLISLAVQAMLFSLFYNWVHPGAAMGTWANLTNGPFGVAGIPKPAAPLAVLTRLVNLLGFRLDALGAMAVLSVILAIGCLCVSRLLLTSAWGRLLKAMRDDELALRGLGKNVRLAKLQLFAVSCGLAAVAGALYASYVSYIDPSTASLDESILMLCMVIVGGAGNFRGPLFGAFILLAIPEGLRFAHISDAVAADIRLALYGVLLMILMHFRPQGVAGEYRIE